MFISRVRSFDVFGEQENKLTSEDIKSITTKCDELGEWPNSYPITEDEIEKQRTGLIEFVERLRIRIKEKQQSDVKKKKAVLKQRNVIEIIEDIEGYVEEAETILESNETSMSFRDKEGIRNLCWAQNDASIRIGYNHLKSWKAYTMN
ncbi:uncharacterized protein LOC144420857 [Styela clava]